MKRLIFIVLIMGYLLSNSFVAFAMEVPYTQEDRDRLVRVEAKIEALQKQIDDLKASTQKQIDDLKASTQKQIDDLRVLLLWGFGILFGGMGLLIGFVIWDRRTAVAPVANKTRELEEREEKIEKALRDLARKDPKVAESLKHAGLL